MKPEWIRHWQRKQVGYLQINRPDKANAYNQDMLDAFLDALERMEEDDSVRVIVVCAAGARAFCAGADLAELQGRDYRDGLELKSARVFSRLAASSRVTIAAINGAAAGGGFELALACDLRIASSHARFFFPEAEHGLLPAAGGTRRLPGIVGVGKAKELILGGRIWRASEALRFGLVSEVVKVGSLMRAAQQWGERIARRDMLALRLAKRAVDASAERPAGPDFEAVAEALLYQVRRDRTAS